MNAQKLFIGFLESIREQNPALVEAVKEGYSAILEAGDKIMDHTEYPKRLRTKTEAELRYIIQDASAAMKAMPDNPNNGYYADEVNYCADELHRRKQKELIKQGKKPENGLARLDHVPAGVMPIYAYQGDDTFE